MRRVNKAGLTVKLLLILFMLVSVIFPLCCMLFNLFEVDFGAIVSSPQFLSASLNSVVVALCATIISVALAFVLAWCLAVSYTHLAGLYHHHRSMHPVL